MYKLSGAALIIVMTTYYGFYLAGQLKERINVIDAYIHSLNYIQSQIKYGLTPLPVICSELSKSITNSIVSSMYEQVYIKLSDITQKEDTFNEIWLSEAKKLIKSGIVKKEEISVIKELGNINTYIDRNMQLQCAGNVEYKLKNIYQRLQSEAGTRSKIYQISGVMAGIVITIILI